MQRRHRKTLEALFAHPTSGGIRWRDAEALLRALGAELQERSGSRVAVILNGRVAIMHRPHPRPTMDKGAVASLRDFLTLAEIGPDNEEEEEKDDEEDDDSKSE